MNHIPAAQMLLKRLQTSTQHSHPSNPEKSLSRRIRTLPDCNPDGTDITTLNQLAAVMGVDRKTVPYYVLEQKNSAHPDLLLEAFLEVKGSHDLIFFENRNTPQVVGRGSAARPKAGYGKVVKRRAATAAEERMIARGDWLRVDRHGNKPGDGKYKGGSNYRPQLRNAGSKANPANGDEGFTGAYIMAKVAPDDAKRLAVDGYEEPNDLHVTLGFFADPAANYNDDDRAKIEEAITAALPMSCLPFTARAFASTTMNPDAEGDEQWPCAVLLVQSDALKAIRDAVEEAVGPQLSTQYPIWIPHVTIGYGLDAVKLASMMGPIKFDQIVIGWGNQIVPVETKTVIRRVRSREGETRFGVPIGTPITARMRETVLASSRSGDTTNELPNTDVLKTPERTGKSTAHLPTVEEVEGNNKYQKTYEVFHKGKSYGRTERDQNLNFVLHVKDGLENPDIMTNDKGEKPLRVSDPNQFKQYLARIIPTSNWKREHTGIAYSRTYYGEVRATKKDSAGAYHGYKIGMNEAGQMVVTKDAEFYGGTPRATYYMKGTTQNEASKIIAADMGMTEADLARNKKIDMKGNNFTGYYLGIYGYDYEPKDIDWNSTAQRAELVDEHAAYLRTKFVGDINIDAMETAMSAMQTYEEMYPGWSRIHPIFKGEKTPGGNTGVIASNSPIPALNDFMAGYHGIDHRGEDENHAGSAIRLTPKYFGRNAGVKNLQYSVEEGAKNNWFSVDPAAIKEALPDDEDWRIAQMAILSHEFGHTVAFAINGNYTWPGESQLDAHERGQKFNNDLVDLLTDWQCWNKSEGKYGPSITGIDDAKMRQQHMGVLDTERMKTLLSKYGGSSIHELCAESWAEYQMNPQPRTFAYEVASLMESYFQEYMKALTEAGFPE